jgi:ABC-type transport system involved in multi-copper enzyme maturation permease subunit
MLATIIRKELLENLMTLRFGLTCLLCLVALCLGTYVNVQQYRKDLADMRTNEAIHRHEVENYDQPWQITWRGVKVDPPVNVMRIFVSRTGSRGAQTISITQDTEPQPADDAVINAVEWLFPRIDLTFFVGVVMSLLALVFSYDSVSGEKERGTLRLMLSYSVPRDICLIGKWIGGFLALIMPFTLALLCAICIAVFSPDVQFTSNNWLQLIGIYVLSILYLAGIYSLGLFISTRSSNAAGSAVLALLAWVILVTVLPNISPYIGAEVSATGSLPLLGQKKREVINTAWEQFETEQKRYDKEHNIPDKWWEKGLDEFGEQIHSRQLAMTDIELKSTRYITTEQEKLNNEFLNGIDRQVTVSRNIGRVTLFSSFMYALLTVAGEDASNQRPMRKQLIDYKERLADYGFAKQNDETNYTFTKKQWSYKLSTDDMPKFVWLDATSSLNSDFYIDAGLLVVWNVIFFLGAFMSFLRYDVR